MFNPEKNIQQEEIDKSASFQAKYIEIQESDIHLTKRESWEDYDDDSFELVRYEYKTTIAGYPYVFYLTAEDVKDEIGYYSTLGRIDFDINGEKVISNIGLEQIHKANNLIKDLFKFLYVKHNTKKIIVEASKSDIKLQDLSSLIKEIQVKADDLKSRSLVLENMELVFGENQKGLKEIVIQGSIIEFQFFSGEKEVVSADVFFNFIKDPYTLSDKELRLSIMDFLESLKTEDKKQKQRLLLYKRRLEKIGFLIEEKGDHFFATASDTLIAELMNK